jgi:hypothetical protein
MHLDFHTGLGRWGQGKLLLDVPLPPERVMKLRQAFGESAVSEHQSGDVVYTARGSFGAWCTARMEGRDYTALCAEFGTYSGLSVVAGLRAENQAHHWGSADSAAFERAKRRLVELFCPRSPSWRRQTLAQGVEMCRQAEVLLRD